MKLALILIGGIIILAVVACTAVVHDRDMGRIAEFYQRNGSAVLLPHELMPDAIQPVGVLGFIAGGVMVLVGILKSSNRSAP